MKSGLIRQLVIVAAVLTLGGCNPTGTPPVAQGDAARPFTVAAAADLQFAFTEIGAGFEDRTGQKTIFTFGSTGTLAKQIENGAPIDLFAAAYVEVVEDLAEKGLLIPDTQQLYAVGRIVLASNKAAGVEVQDLAGLLDPRVKRLAIANPDHAPYGLAAKEALVNADVWEGVQPKLIFGDNIRQTLQLIQTGNAEAGIVALSVANVPEITYQVIDDRLHSPLRQGLAAVQGSPNEKAAREFISYVNSPEGRSVMKKYGFVLPGEF